MEMPMEKKEKRTGAIIGTIVAILLCGCPGLVMCLFGVGALAGLLNYSNVGFDVPQWSGGVLLCLSIIFVLIAVLVPVLTLRKKKPADTMMEVPPPQEPLPPAS